MASIIPVETSYKIWFPKDIYSNAVPVIIFMKENCMDYDNFRNCYIIKPSTQTGGKAIINFTAVNGDVYTASLSADSYRIFSGMILKMPFSRLRRREFMRIISLQEMRRTSGKVMLRH